MTDDTKTWLTPAAHQKLVEELEYLTTEGRNAVTKRIAEARDHGDLRENAEYDTAKNDQGLMEARIRQITATLDNSEIREASNDGTVDVGSVVTCIDDDGDEMEFFVAPPENKVAGMLLASPSSPLGGALMGAKPGDKVSYEAPGGKFTYEVKAIRPYEG